MIEMAVICFVPDIQMLIVLWMLRFQTAQSILSLDQEGAAFPMSVRYVAQPYGLLAGENFGKMVFDWESLMWFSLDVRIL